MTSRWPSYRTRFVHLTAIWAYGVTQPLYTVIDGNPDLLMARGLSRLELAVFAILVAVVPPAIATAYVWLAGRFSTWVGDALYLAIFGGALVPLAARAVKLVDPGLLAAVALMAALATAGVVVYARFRLVRLFVGYAIVLPLAGLVLFVQGLPSLTEDAEAAGVRPSSPAPVVFLVLDELPISSLMTRNGEIDSVRYPNFARLASAGTWYPNATTVHEWTKDSVPAMLTGRVARPGTLATVENYPENLFTLLGETYTLQAREAYATRLCPERACPQRAASTVDDGVGLLVDSVRVLATRIVPVAMLHTFPKVDAESHLHHESAASITEFNELLGAISRSEARDALFYSHLLVPHRPWRFLPSGRQYQFTGFDGWLPGERWVHEPLPVLQAYQRHLLQAGYTDRLLGRLLHKLASRGLFDDALVVVVADHGISFRPGEGRRPLTADNLADITNVPMFVKYPAQRGGRVDRRPARTTDLLPTIADVIGVPLPWRVDGTSLLGPLPAGRDVFVEQRDGEALQAPLDEMIRDRQVTLQRKVAAFGEARDSLYRIGKNRRLLGRNVAHIRGESDAVVIGIQNHEALLDVRPESGFVPARITGYVTRGRVDPASELAVAVNGRIRALTRPFRGGVQRFRALVPESAFRRGSNRVEVFVVQVANGDVRLVRLGSSSGSEVAAGE